MLRHIKRAIKIIVFGMFAKLCSIFEKPTNLSIKQARTQIEHLRPYPAKKSVVVNLPTDPKIDISIVVPVYNTGKYVKKCVDSILAQQTSYIMQILLIDDGSTDSSSTILESYRNIPQVQIIHQSNGGLSAARNKGLNCSRGKYIMFIDSDDIIPSYAVETLMKIACSTNAEIVQGSHKEFTCEDELKREHIPKCFTLDVKSRLQQKMEMDCFAWNKVYLRSLFEEVRWPEDFLFEDITNPMILFQISGMAITTSIVTYYYRNNTEGIMHTHQENNKTLDIYWVVEELYDRRNKMNLPIMNSDYNFLLNQLCIVNGNRLRKYPINIQKDVFLLSCDFLERHQPQEKKELTYRQHMIEHSLLHKKFRMWRCCSRMI